MRNITLVDKLSAYGLLVLSSAALCMGIIAPGFVAGALAGPSAGVGAVIAGYLGGLVGLARGETDGTSRAALIKGAIGAGLGSLGGACLGGLITGLVVPAVVGAALGVITGGTVVFGGWFVTNKFDPTKRMKFDFKKDLRFSRHAVWAGLACGIIGTGFGAECIKDAPAIRSLYEDKAALKDAGSASDNFNSAAVKGEAAEPATVKIQLEKHQHAKLWH